MNPVSATLSEIKEYECLSMSRYVRRLTRPNDVDGALVLRPSANNFSSPGRA
jgi:hypothetical protein